MDETDLHRTRSRNPAVSERKVLKERLDEASGKTKQLMPQKRIGMSPALKLMKSLKLTAQEQSIVRQLHAHGLSLDDAAAMWGFVFQRIEAVRQNKEVVVDDKGQVHTVGGIDDTDYAKILVVLAQVAARLGEASSKLRGDDLPRELTVNFTIEGSVPSGRGPDGLALPPPGDNGDEILVE